MSQGWPTVPPPKPQKPYPWLVPIGTVLFMAAFLIFLVYYGGWQALFGRE